MKLFIKTIYVISLSFIAIAFLFYSKISSLPESQKVFLSYAVFFAFSYIIIVPFFWYLNRVSSWIGHVRQSRSSWRDQKTDAKQ